MTTFTLFQLYCFVIEDGININKNVYINPSFVIAIERANGLTKVITTKEEYYTTISEKLILRGLKDVTLLNNKIVMSN